MKKLLDYKTFLETNLVLSELDKIKNGESRGNILISKLKGKEPLETTNKKSVIIDKMKDGGVWVEPDKATDNISDKDGLYDTDKAFRYFKTSGKYNIVFKDGDGDELKVSDLKKTVDFGSSGAGRLVRQFESIQCIFLAIKQEFPDKLLSPINFLRFFRKYKDRLDDNGKGLCILPEKIELDESLMTEFLKDKNWISTFCRIPNRLWKSKYLDLNKRYSIYHVGYSKTDSPFITILNKYKEFSKTGGFADINIAKWCPADAYLISTTEHIEVLDSINSTENIDELNIVIDKFFDSKTLIPLSLKKITAESKFSIITNKEIGKELPDFFIKSFMIGSDMKGIGSKISVSSVWKHRDNKNVDRSDRNINFDSSNSSKDQDIDGEVEGSSSRHGKISFKAIKRIIESSGKFKIQSHTELRILTIEELKLLFVELTDLINSKKSTSVNILCKPVRGTDISNNEGRLVSRIQSLQVVLAILELYILNKKMANDVITKIVRYALSIQTDKFNTARYLRVI